MDILAQLESLSEPGFAEFQRTSLAVRPGGYGEGDTVLGVRMGNIRKIAESVKKAESGRVFGMGEAAKLLRHKAHEARMLGLLILLDRYSDEAVEAYMENLAGVNNWDLVDASAPGLIGRWCVENNDFGLPGFAEIRRGRLFELAASPNMWEQRIAMVGTLAATRAGDVRPCMEMAELFLGHMHDLMHKAAGWMLREAGKRNLGALLGFLDRHAREMPRTMLRYAIERMDPEIRLEYMRK